MTLARYRPWLAVVIALTTSACSIDLTLRPDGSCKLRMVYPLVAPTTVAVEKRRFISPYVRVSSLELRDGRTAVVRAVVSDVTKLPTTQFFQSLSVHRAAENGDERITATFFNAMPREVTDEGQPGPRIDATLPGPVREANRNAVVTGDHVRWRFSLSEFVRHPRVDLSVRYARTPTS
jgi:hypothetical protein